MCLALLVPFVASADSLSDLRSQIQALLSQVKVLQDQVRVIEHGTSTTITTASTTPVHTDEGDSMDHENDHGLHLGRLCIQGNRNLGFGSRGDDVKMVQQVLASDPSIFTGSTTGFFGRETAKAMIKFQMKFGIASSTTGFVGSTTRQFFRQHCPPTANHLDEKNDHMGTTTEQKSGQHGDKRMKGDEHGEMQGNIHSSSTRPTPPLPPQNTEVHGDETSQGTR